MRRALFAVAMFAVSPVLAAEEPKAETAPPVQYAPDPDLEHPAYTYRICLDLSGTQPDKAIELAGKWVGLGGGEAAKHCQALALVGLKEYGEGATRLEELAASSKQTATIRANMLAQAAQAWMLTDEFSRAYAAQTTALKIIPQGTHQHIEILLDRAGTLAETGRYDEAITDVNAALRIEPSNPDAIAFRASAHRMQGELDDALLDAESALAINPMLVTALLERGNIYRIQKKLPEARRDWLRVLEIDPNSAMADAARTNIERMDVDPHASVKD